MKIVFLFLALVLVTVNGEQLLRDDEADETDDALSSFEVFEDIEDIEERGDALSPFEVFEDMEYIEDRAAKKQKKSKKSKTSKKANSTEDADDIESIEERGDFNKKYTTGKLVKLGSYYTAGIPLRVLFTFDTDFVKTFKTAGINKFMQLTKKNLDATTLKKLIGTTIKLTGTIRKVSKSFKDTGGSRGKGDWPDTFKSDAAKQTKYYDVYQYVQGNPKNNGGGISNGATVCKTKQPKERISMVMAPTKKDCTADKIASTKCFAYRISKAAKSAAHEIGHTIGMMHDFKDPHKRGTAFTYRKYDGNSCAGGFMSYVNQGKKGWSACSARDFSRFLTKGGTTKPCLNYKTLNKDNRKVCASTCLAFFKRYVTHFKSYGCSKAYSMSRDAVDAGYLTTDCAKGCKSTTKMAALAKSC